MTTSTPQPPAPSSIIPLSLWLLLQLLALLLPVLQIPLSDQFPRPIEKAAIEEMLVIQMTLAALLMPLLFRDWGASLLLIASAWPFLQLAGILSSTPAINILHLGLYVTGWLALLSIWGMILRTERSRLIASAIFAALTLGDALQGYLRVEFTLEPTSWRGVYDLFPGVLRGGFSLLRGQSFPWPLPLALLLSITFALLTHRRRST